MEGTEILLLHKAGVMALKMEGTLCQTCPMHLCCLFLSGHAVSQFLRVSSYVWDHPAPSL